MIITLTKAAKQYLKTMLAKDTNLQGIYISLDKAGCAGYMYKLHAVATIPENTIREYIDGIALCIDTDSIPRLKGSSLDYQKQGIELKAVFNNPNVRLACGCGDSVELINKDKTDDA